VACEDIFPAVMGRTIQQVHSWHNAGSVSPGRLQEEPAGRQNSAAGWCAAPTSCTFPIEPDQRCPEPGDCLSRPSRGNRGWGSAAGRAPPGTRFVSVDWKSARADQACLPLCPNASHPVGFSRLELSALEFIPGRPGGGSGHTHGVSDSFGKGQQDGRVNSPTCSTLVLQGSAVEAISLCWLKGTDTQPLFCVLSCTRMTADFWPQSDVNPSSTPFVRHN